MCTLQVPQHSRIIIDTHRLILSLKCPSTFCPSVYRQREGLKGGLSSFSMYVCTDECFRETLKYVCGKVYRCAFVKFPPSVFFRVIYLQWNVLAHLEGGHGKGMYVNIPTERRRFFFDFSDVELGLNIIAYADLEFQCT